MNYTVDDFIKANRNNLPIKESVQIWIEREHRRKNDAGKKGRKASVYLGELHTEVLHEAYRTGQSISQVLQQAWHRAKSIIATYPSATDLTQTHLNTLARGRDD